MKEKKDNENYRLLKLVALGDKKARDEVINRNLAFVNYAVQKVYNSTNLAEQEDIFEYGVLGLIKAVDNFEEDKGSFLALAFTCIRNEIYMYLRQVRRQFNVISIDDSMPNLAASKMGEEIKIIELLKSDQASPEEVVVKEDTLTTIKSIIEYKLPEKQSQVLKARYYTSPELTQAQLGKELGFSQSYCARLEKKGITFLKNELKKIENA